jgi:hypothetical protein
MASKTAQQILDSLPGSASKLTKAAASLTVEDIVSLEAAFANFDSKRHSAGGAGAPMDSCCCCCTAVSSISSVPRRW